MRYYVWVFRTFLSVLTFALVFNLAHTESDVLSESDLSTLRFVHSIFRHGDRNPASTFPTDVNNNESTWKGGFGELTTIGIKGQFELGQFIKKRYKGFLSETYSTKEIHIRSTSYNRTLMSAAANLAGMYPPTGDQIWNKSLLWQPIPVHSRPREDDPVLWMDKPCPTVKDLYKNKVFNSEPYKRIQRDNAEFLEFLRVKTGRETMPLIDLWDIFDPLNCETAHSDTHKRPEWATDDVYIKIKELHRLSITFYYKLPEIRRLRGALMFNEIGSRFLQKSTNSSTYIQDLKYFAYSIHDTTQVALLENLEAYDGSAPTYDQILFMELHEINGTYYVKMYKRNETVTNSLIYVPISTCGDLCPLNQFYKLSLANKPGDWNVECGLNTGFLQEDAEQIVGLLAAFCMLIFVCFVVLLAFYCRLRRGRYVREQLD